MTTLEEVRARFARDQGLPFADSLSQASILDALNQHGVKFRDRLFSPVTTIWGFLSQVLSDDHSCRDAVSRILAHRAASGLEPCSPNTASYCNARSPPPHRRAAHSWPRRTAQQLQDGMPQAWKWNGRNVFIADGSHVSMPDTQENQEAYPQPVVQQPGIGFPWPGSPCCCRWRAGPATTWPSRRTPARAPARPRCCGRCTARSQPGDVVLADALFDNYFLACELVSAASSWSPACRPSVWGARR